MSPWLWIGAFLTGLAIWLFIAYVVGSAVGRLLRHRSNEDAP